MMSLSQNKATGIMSRVFVSLGNEDQGSIDVVGVLGPRSFSWTDYWTGTDFLVKSLVPGTGPGSKLSVHRLTEPGPGPIK
jgi:hypothetical protein